MRRLPDELKTRADIERVMSAARSGDLRPDDRRAMLGRLRGLASDQRWVKSRVLEDDEEPEDGARVLEEEQDDGTVERVEYVQEDDPSARRIALGLSADEVDDLITEMEGLIDG